MTVDNNPAILAYRQIQSVINSNITDINAYRLALTAGDKDKQWLFPYVPSSLDEMYPRITISLRRAVPENQNAGDYFDIDYADGLATQIVLGQYVHLFFDVVCFIKRDQKHSVTLLGELTAKSIKNNLQAMYMMNQVQKQLRKNRDTFISNGFEDIIVGDMDAPYEDGEHFFATKVPITIIVPNIWGQEFEETDLIASYTLAIVAELG